MLLSASVGMSAQTIYEQNFSAAQSLATSGFTLISQDFNTGPANDWVRTTIEPANGVMASFSWYNVVLTPNNYVFTPAINLSTITGPIKLSYKHAATDADFDAEKYNLYVTTSPTVAAATTTSLLHSQTTMNNINTLTEISFDLSAYAGQTIYLCFRHFGVSDQFNLVIDDIKVEKLVSNNLSLDAVTVPDYLLAGNFTFTGQVTNRGQNPVTSYQISWQSNGGTVNTYTVSGVNIAVGATHTFTHNLPLNAEVGQQYALNFSVGTVNEVTDGDPSNNTLAKSTQVASGSTTFKPMIEKFTSSTCFPCASYNGSTFNPFYIAQNQNFNYVAYQQDFPGAGDIYATLESIARRDYYGINAITSLRINGADYSTGNNQAALTAYIAAQNTRIGYFAMSATRDFTGNNAAVTYNITPYLSGSYILHTIVMEKTTTANVGPNGETSFKHVMMKMMPNENGTPITFTAGTPVSGTLTAALAGTNIEQISDCEVVMFIQNPVTKEIMQSFKAADLLAVPTNTIAETIKLYPNPSSSVVRLSILEKVNVTVTDLLGKTVMNLKDVTNQTDINVSALQNGVYLFSVQNQTGSQTIKFVKN